MSEEWNTDFADMSAKSVFHSYDTQFVHTLFV